MAHSTSKHADFEGPRQPATALHREGLSRGRTMTDRTSTTRTPSTDHREESRHRNGRNDRTQRTARGTEFLIGVGPYRAEGSKAKAYSRRERVTFVNSDPNMITVFAAWPEPLRVDSGSPGFAPRIHETADVGAARKFRAGPAGTDPPRFLKATPEKHHPTTNRKNIAERLQGCPRIDGRGRAGPYRRIEGWWYGIVEAASAVDLANRK